MAQTHKYVLMLGAMSALGAVSTDMYLPNLPDVAVDLHTSATMAQFTMTFMMLGGALGQLVIGPLSDRFGRRLPAMIGTALHVVSCALCMFAPAIAPLIGYRAAMGFCNAAAGVTATAIIRDRFVGRDAARLMSRLMLVIGAAPLFAPTVGSFIGQYVGWRGVFAALGLYGIGLMIAMWWKLPETLPPARRSPHSAAVFQGFGGLLKDGHFTALAVVPALMSAAFMTYIVSSSFVLQGQYQLSSLQFALVFGCNGVALVAGAQVNAALVTRFSPSQILRVAVPISLIGCVVLMILGFTGWGGLPGLLVTLFVIMAVQNASPSNASALALTRHGEKAGTAAAFIGFMQSVIPAVVAPIVGLLGNQSWAMGLVMTCGVLAALLVLAVGTPIYRPGGAELLDRLPTSI